MRLTAIRMLARDWRVPTRVRSRVLETGQSAGSPEPVAASFESTFEYDDEVTAYEFSSFRAGFSQRLELYGTDGQISVDDYVLPYLDSEV